MTISIRQRQQCCRWKRKGGSCLNRVDRGKARGKWYSVLNNRLQSLVL